MTKTPYSLLQILYLDCVFAEVFNVQIPLTFVSLFAFSPNPTIRMVNKRALKMLKWSLPESVHFPAVHIESCQVLAIWSLANAVKMVNGSCKNVKLSFPRKKQFAQPSASNSRFWS